MVKRVTQKEHNAVEQQIQLMVSKLENFDFDGMSREEEGKWYAEFSSMYSDLLLKVALWHKARGR